jgi:hypothetical protein
VVLVMLHFHIMSFRSYVSAVVSATSVGLYMVSFSKLLSDFYSYSSVMH